MHQLQKFHQAYDNIIISCQYSTALGRMLSGDVFRSVLGRRLAIYWRGPWEQRSFGEGGIGQNQNCQCSCKKNYDQEVQHFLKNKMIFIWVWMKYFFLYDVVKTLGFDVFMQNKNWLATSGGRIPAVAVCVLYGQLRIFCVTELVTL